MMYLIILFISPVYFIIRGKWGGFILNMFFYGLASLLLISIIFASVAPLPWLIGVGHATWHIRSEVMEENATIMAEKMAEAMRQKDEMGG